MASRKQALRCFICNKKCRQLHDAPDQKSVLEDLSRTFFKYWILLELGKSPGFRIDNEFPFCKLCKTKVVKVHSLHGQIQGLMKEIRGVMASVSATLILTSSARQMKMRRPVVLSPAQLTAKEKVEEMRHLGWRRYNPTVVVHRLGERRKATKNRCYKESRGARAKQIERIPSRPQHSKEAEISDSELSSLREGAGPENYVPPKRRSSVEVEVGSDEDRDCDEVEPPEKYVRLRRNRRRRSATVKNARFQRIIRTDVTNELNNNKGTKYNQDSDVMSASGTPSPISSRSASVSSVSESTDDIMILDEVAKKPEPEKPRVNVPKSPKKISVAPTRRAPTGRKRGRPRKNKEVISESPKVNPSPAKIIGLPCRVCGERFPSTFLLREHHRSKHAGAGFTCDECDEKFKNRTDFILHKRSAHKNADDSKAESPVKDPFERDVKMPTVKDRFEEDVKVSPVKNPYQSDVKIPAVKDRFEGDRKVPPVKYRFEVGMEMATGKEHFDGDVSMPAVRYQFAGGVTMSSTFKPVLPPSFFQDYAQHN